VFRGAQWGGGGGGGGGVWEGDAPNIYEIGPKSRSRNVYGTYQYCRSDFDPKQMIILCMHYVEK
jgi:hypothetical protein